MVETIGVIIPSRGLVVAETIQSVIANVQDAGVEAYYAIPTGYNIPDCFNKPIADMIALHPFIQYVWIVEEDVEVPRHGLQALIKQHTDIAAIDYPFPNGYGCVAYYRGKPVWCGTGCTLINMSVFRKLQYPWFRTDVAYIIEEDGAFSRRIVPSATRYGGHDIDFCLTAQHNGLSLSVVPDMLGKHRKLKNLGASGINNGRHEFVTYSEILKVNTLKRNPTHALDNLVF